jgi:hypothetical protein
MLDLKAMVGDAFRAGFISTVHAENAFGHLRQFISRCTRAPQATTVCEYHYLLEAKRMHLKYLDEHQGSTPRRNKLDSRSRPAWIQDKKWRTQRRPSGTAAAPHLPRPSCLCD